MIFERKVVYSNKEKKTSLSFALYQDGIRMLAFKRGLDREELLRFISLLATDFSKAEMLDQDLYCLFLEMGFSHVDLTGSDILGDIEREDPKLKEQIESFVARVGQASFPPAPNNPRKLRSDDLKVLEEFRLNPAQFTRSDEEVARVIQGIAIGRETKGHEQETLERLLAMGFHFLLTEKDGEQLSVGRDLVVKVSHMILVSGSLPLFEAVLQKLYQMQKDRMDQAGEIQKIIDQIFHVDQLPIFNQLLKSPEHQKMVTKLLMLSNSGGVKLLIQLLGEHPWLHRVVGDFLLKHLSNHMVWLIQEAESKPEHPSWEYLINILASKPTHHFQKFLEVHLKSAAPTVRIKVLKQLAQIGTSEALHIFDRLLKSEKDEERMQVYDVLGAAQSKNALKFLKVRMDSKEFQSSATAEEREAMYRCLFTIGAEAAWPWCESMWMQPGEGLFKKKAETERRMLLLKAVVRSHPEWIERLLQKTPLESLAPELRDTIHRMKHRISTGGPSK